MTGELLEPRFAAISEAVGTHKASAVLGPLGAACGMSLAQLRGREPSGKGPTRFRHVAMFLMRTQAKWSYPEIGLYFDHRDHSTVIHGCRAVLELRKENTAFASFLQQIEAATRDKAAAVPGALRRSAVLAAPTRGIVHEMRGLRADVAGLREELAMLRKAMGGRRG